MAAGGAAAEAAGGAAAGAAASDANIADMVRTVVRALLERLLAGGREEVTVAELRSRLANFTSRELDTALEGIRSLTVEDGVIVGLLSIVHVYVCMWYVLYP